MKSPLKDSRHKNLSRGFLKTIIPFRSRVNSYGIFSGHTELSLSRTGITISSFTDKDVIYQFWECLCENPHRMHSLLVDPSFKFGAHREFAVLQETLPLYKDSYIRSSLFFLLNRCSSTGQISCGEFEYKNYNASALNQLKIFKKPRNFDVFKYSCALKEHIENNQEVDFVLFPNLIFGYNLFDMGKSIGYDTYMYNHNELKKVLRNSSVATILVYNRHSTVFSFFKDFNYYLIDKNGRITTDQDTCEEIIVTNF